MTDTVIDSASPLYGHVDHVMVMTCTRYRTRHALLEGELRRLGIMRYNTLMQPDSPLPSAVIQRFPGLRLGDDFADVARANIWAGHYRAVRICYDLGYDNVLLLEDDAVFVRNLDVLRASLAEMDRQYSMVLFDPTIMSRAHHDASVARGTAAGLHHWALVGPEDADLPTCPRCAGCRLMSRDAISEYVHLHECLFLSGCDDDVVLCPADMWHSRIVHATGKPLLYAVPPLSIQGLLGEHGMFTGMAHSLYRSFGVDVSKYGQLDRRGGVVVWT